MPPLSFTTCATRRGASLCALLTALALAVTASAARADGASVINIDRCVTLEFGMFCVKAHEVFNLTQTPSGIISVMTNQDLQQTFVGGGCSNQEISRTRSHTMVGPQTDEAHLLFSAVFTGFLPDADCDVPGDTLVCTTEIHVQISNGVVRFEDAAFACTVNPPSAPT
jgi:hypothetical protein